MAKRETLQDMIGRLNHEAAASGAQAARADTVDPWAILSLDPAVAEVAWARWRRGARLGRAS